MSRDCIAIHFPARGEKGLVSRDTIVEVKRKLTSRVHSNGRHRVHGRFGDVLDDDRNVVIPHTHSFVVRSGDESSIVVDKVDGVDRSQMLVVFLGDFSGIHVVLMGRVRISAEYPGQQGRKIHQLE